MFQHIFFIVVQLQGFQYDLIPLCQLGSGKPQGDFCLFGMVFDQVHDAVDTPVHRGILILLTAEIHSGRRFLILCHMNGMTDQLGDALIFRRGNGNHGNAQHLLHLIDADRTAVLPDFVHHIQGNDHGDIQLHQLHGKIHIPLNIGSIHNVDDPFRLFS